MSKAVLIWLKSLAAAFIGGGANAASAWLGLVAAQSIGVEVPTLNLQALGIIFLTSGLLSTLTYLKKSPLPGTGDLQIGLDVAPGSDSGTVSRRPENPAP